MHLFHRLQDVKNFGLGIWEIGNMGKLAILGNCFSPLVLCILTLFAFTQHQKLHVLWIFKYLFCKGFYKVPKWFDLITFPTVRNFFLLLLLSTTSWTIHQKLRIIPIAFIPLTHLKADTMSPLIYFFCNLDSFQLVILIMKAKIHSFTSPTEASENFLW